MRDTWPCDACQKSGVFIGRCAALPTRVLMVAVRVQRVSSGCYLVAGKRRGRQIAWYFGKAEEAMHAAARLRHSIAARRRVTS